MIISKVFGKIIELTNGPVGDAIVYAALGAMITINAKDVGGVLLILGAAIAAYRLYRAINQSRKK